jgi:DNA-binding transcriptional ArsR family regulator
VANRPKQDIGSARLLRAISNCIRIDILRILNERVASPKELASAMELELSLVSHHVTELRKEGCIKQVRTEPRRGAVEHYYRADVPALFNDKDSARLPRPARNKLSSTVLQVLISEIASSVHAGAFDARSDRHLSWMPFSVDGEGWDELTGLFAEVLERVEQIKAASNDRLAESSESGQRVIAAMLGFEAPAVNGGSNAEH